MSSSADTAPICANERPGYRPRRANHSTSVPYDTLPLALQRAELAESGLAAASSVVYQWDFNSDAVAWSPGWRTFAGQAGDNAPTDGKSWWSKICAQGRDQRYEALFGSGEADEGNGVPFTAIYQLSRSGPAGAFDVIEEGRWYADEYGKPCNARGVLRCGSVAGPGTLGQQPQSLDAVTCKAASATEANAGFLSRPGLQAALGREVGQCVRHGGSAGFLLIGIDGLAKLNHGYGFEVTDKVIAAVWERIRAAAPAYVTLAHYTGNKLGIVIPRGHTGGLDQLADSIISSVSALPPDVDIAPVPVNLSIGGVNLPDQANSSEMAMYRGEEALAIARKNLNCSFSPYTPSSEREELRRKNLGLADRLVSGLNDRRFHIDYQPIISSQNGNVSFFECLLRLTETDGTVTSAGAFMSAAEQLGMARLLDHRVLELTLATLAGRDDIALSVNVSPLTVLSPDWIGCLEAAVRNRHTLTDRLIVEITETVAIEDIDGTALFVDRLRKLGCRVAIDDFGAGYTSFRNLKLLDVDMVKIDGEFVRNLSSSADDQIFVRTLIDLAKNFDLETVAEFVETGEDAKLLKSWGVTGFQGYHFGRPSPELPAPVPVRKPKRGSR